MRALTIVGAVLLGALLIVAGALGARWFIPADAAAPADARVVVEPKRAPPTIDLELLRSLLTLTDSAQRERILGSAEAFAQFVHQETLNQAVMQAAYANDADKNAQIRALMERAGQRALVESYLHQVVRVNLDPDFPTDAQLREAYDKNPDAFRVPERIHLWQIFIPLDAAAPDAEREAAWARADAISRDLRSGKADFATLAKKHSGHEASRVNDGYMGLIAVSDLLPAIAEAATKLEPGAVSEPVASTTGLHILRRGATVAGEMLDFERVRPQLRERLRREAAVKVRQAAVAKIEQEYPVAEPTAELEAWRAALRQEVLPAASTATGSAEPPS